DYYCAIWHFSAYIF
nr:immunoglobulin light chain junction region [Macaca mulatta]MOX83529.1 immunoglobulin light chain junction region [Macaca mulatta]